MDLKLRDIERQGLTVIFGVSKIANSNFWNGQIP